MGTKAKMQRADPDSETVRTASDYSYSATSYAGERFRLVGDAAGTCCLLVMPKFLIGLSLFLFRGQPSSIHSIHLAYTSQ